MIIIILRIIIVIVERFYKSEVATVHLTEYVYLQESGLVEQFVDMLSITY